MTGGGWRRSSRCSTNTCVEVATLGDRVAVRGGEFNPHPDIPDKPDYVN
jgi:hypothetical protein